MFLPVLLFVGVIIYFLVVRTGSSSFKFTGRKSPEDVLKERFVNGEIDEETYKKMKKTINK